LKVCFKSNIVANLQQKDLYFVCGAVNDKQFLKLCTLLGRPELANEGRFKDNQSRVDNREELGKILNESFAEKTTDEWMKLFDGTGLPYGPINTMERVFDHPQTEAREMVHEVPYEHATSGKLALLGEIHSTKLYH
jgi:succinate---hydroxymethylglutarate CoA-transferase